MLINFIGVSQSQSVVVLQMSERKRRSTVPTETGKSVIEVNEKRGLIGEKPDPNMIGHYDEVLGVKLLRNGLLMSTSWKFNAGYKLTMNYGS